MGDLATWEIPELFEYIARYWKRYIEDLREEPFDLEACYTLLQQQRQEFKAEGNAEREEEVARALRGIWRGLDGYAKSRLERYLREVEGC